MFSLDGVSGESRIAPDSSEPSGSASGERNDKFRPAKIIKFFPHSGYGFVRDQNGKEIYFHLDELRFAGEKRDRSYVIEGASVGIDVGRTSRGLRVTRLKIY
jgi:cold shock CspA family protein